MDIVSHGLWGSIAFGRKSTDGLVGTGVKAAAPLVFSLLNAATRMKSDRFKLSLAFPICRGETHRVQAHFPQGREIGL